MSYSMFIAWGGIFSMVPVNCRDAYEGEGDMNMTMEEYATIGGSKACFQWHC